MEMKIVLVLKMWEIGKKTLLSDLVTQSIVGLSKAFSFLCCTTEREREKESPHNPLSLLPDKTATANNAWDLVNQTTLAFFFYFYLSLSPTLSWVLKYLGYYIF